MHDKFKKAHRTPRADDRLRSQIAIEAARRLTSGRGEGDATWLEATTESEFYTAKRKAAAVLGRKVRPGDLPTDSEVRIQALELIRSGLPTAPSEADAGDVETETEPVVARAADHLNRFTLYRMRLLPLESFKQNPKTHPEGDALYHSLQVFEIARETRPYDEEFLLAALLHDVGKAVDPSDHVGAGVDAIRGSVTDRTLRLIARHHDLDDSPRARRPIDEPADFLDDLRLLHELDLGGRTPGRPVESLDAALAYIKGLEREDYLRET